MKNMLATADLCDRFLDVPGDLQVLTPGLRSFGGRRAYGGQIATLAPARAGTPVRLRDALSQPGQGRVLVADAHANASWALLGDQLAALGLANGWAGVVLNGYVRDLLALGDVDIGVHAIGTTPRRPREFEASDQDCPVEFQGTRFTPSSWLFADEDGIVVCERNSRTDAILAPFFS